MKKKIIGLPRMTTKPGFRREFTPEFVKKMSSLAGVTVWLEANYGQDLGFSQQDYTKIGSNVQTVERNKIFASADIVLLLASPQLEDIASMHKGQTLISMLHFPTHPERNQLMKQLGIQAISLDEIKDFEQKRLIQDFKHCAYSALTVGFVELRNNLGEEYWFDPKREDIVVFNLGLGEVGKYAVEAALRMGYTNFIQELIEKGGNPTVQVIPLVSIHTSQYYLEKNIKSQGLKIGGKPHILVDVTQRKSLNQVIIPEDILATLPSETVIVDISADRYEDGRVVKAIEGIPTGDETKFVFSPRDPEWNDPSVVPVNFQIKESSRRTVASHYAWPSFGTVDHRVASMQKYGSQIEPLIERIRKINWKNPQKYEAASWSLEKALYLSSLDYFLKSNPDKVKPEIFKTAQNL